MKNENKKTKRYLKGVFETFISNIMIIKIMFILFTIETLNQPLNTIISYLVLVGILTITIIIMKVIPIILGINLGDLWRIKLIRKI